jgi:hypothetical protein
MSADQKLNWCIEAIIKIANASRENDPNVYADGFTMENATTTRTMDADTATTAQVADVLATFINDHKNRGSKRDV